MAASEVSKQLKVGKVAADVNLSLQPPVIKSLNAKLNLDLYNFPEDDKKKRCTTQKMKFSIKDFFIFWAVMTNGFGAAGITEVINDVTNATERDGNTFRKDWSCIELFLLYKYQVNLLNFFSFIPVNPHFHFLSSKIGKFKCYLTLTPSKTFYLDSFRQLFLGVQVLARGKKIGGKLIVGLHLVRENY